MTTYTISNRDSGATVWTGEAETAKAALEAMASDAGYASYAEACLTTEGSGDYDLVKRSSDAWECGRLTIVADALPRPAPRASDHVGGTGSGRCGCEEDARMTITVDLDNGYSEAFQTMREARERLLFCVAAGETGAVVDATRKIRIGDAAWMAWSAGVDWAEREWEAHPNPVAAGAWRPSAIDALPLVDADSDHDDRDALAYIANEAARERWNAMIAEAS